MTITVEQLASLIAVVLGLMSVGGAMIAIGREKQARVDLERRHSELAKETRDRLGANEHRTNGLERWQAAVDAKLAGIHDALVEIKTMLQRGDV